MMSASLMNCFVFGKAPTNFFAFGKNVPRDIQYNNPYKNYNTFEGNAIFFTIYVL